MIESPGRVEFTRICGEELLHIETPSIFRRPPSNIEAGTWQKMYEEIFPVTGKRKIQYLYETIIRVMQDPKRKKSQCL